MENDTGSAAEQGKSAVVDESGETPRTEQTPASEPTRPEPVQKTIAEDRKRAIREAVAKTKAVPDSDAPKRDESGKFVAQPQTPKAETATDPDPPLPAPAEFSAEEKEDFKQLSRKQQEVALRLHRQRSAAFQREFGSTRKLTESVRDYLDLMGQRGHAPEEAITKAIALWREFENDPQSALRAFAAAKKIGVKFEGDEQQKNGAHTPDPHLQNQLSEINNWIAEEKRSKQVNNLQSVWTRFSDAKNAAGKPLLPDMHLSGEGAKEFGGRVGTLFSDPKFRGYVEAVHPGATDEQIFYRAYVECGGRVNNNAEAPRSQDSHSIAKSRRASASVPGQGAQAGSGPDRKFKSRREAIMAAVTDLRSDS